MILCLLQKNKAFFGFTPANAGRQLLTLGLPCLSRFTPAHAGKTMKNGLTNQTWRGSRPHVREIRKESPLNQGFDF